MGDLRLAMYRGRSARIISLGDYLALDPAGRAAAEVDPSWCTMSLIVDGEDHWGPLLGLGALGVVVAQLPQAADRVEAGQLAIVRAAVFDMPVAVFLVFEPAGRDVVVAVASTEKLSDPIWMPNGPRSDALYALVAEDRDALVAPGQEGGIEPQTLPRSVVSACLRRELSLGREVVSLIGEGSC